MENMKWYLVDSYGSTADYEVAYLEEYISEDGKLCKQIWEDGHEEIFNLFDD